MSRKVVEFEIDSAWETRVESSFTKSQIRVNIKNREFVLLEIDAECTIPGCEGNKCGQGQTNIAKIRKSHKGNSILKRRVKERLLDEMPNAGKKVKKEPPSYNHPPRLQQVGSSQGADGLLVRCWRTPRLPDRYLALFRRSTGLGDPQSTRSITTTFFNTNFTQFFFSPISTQNDLQEPKTL